jgi:DNA (cytosine-5)-methyltransferase 1
MREKIVDNFAGGGGASTGIFLALGRSPDIAINHDDVALAMHAVNHPETRHLCNNVWKVDPDEVEGPIGLGWFSPDCKHFSKAKGGKPVEKGIRDLAWVVVRWARRRQGGPRIIILENVEEFSTWGPLGDDGRPCPDRKGATFKQWTGELKRLGYKVEYRELRACDYGAPTIRKRLFLIARNDGLPIVWPQPSHGDPKSEAVKSGRLKPWRTAAEIIDWSLPCPSIFATSEEIMAEYGIRAVRPLAEATMARIAKGVKRYVLDAAKPFIVNLTHQGGDRTESIDDPMMTVTGAHRGEKAIAMPFVTAAQHGGSVRSADDPLHTIAASPKDQNQVVTAMAAPFVTGVGGRMGQTAPRGVHQPAQTITAKADSVVVAPHLTKFRANSVGSGMDQPVPTVTANSFIKRPGGAAPIGLVAAHIMTMRNAQKPFNGADEPTHTVTSGGARLHLVAAFMAQHNISRGDGINPGRAASEPVSTILQSGSHQGPVAVNLLRQFGTGVGSSVDEPARTVMADGGGKTQLSAAFLSKYYGTGEGQEISGPAHTVTTKERFGLVTIDIDGEPFVISDIGLRMLTPRELFRAQGFPDSYIIDIRPDGTPISKTDQVSKCGNSVCPDMARALVTANFQPRDIEDDLPPAFHLEAAE